MAQVVVRAQARAPVAVQVQVARGLAGVLAPGAAAEDLVEAVELALAEAELGLAAVAEARVRVAALAAAELAVPVAGEVWAAEPVVAEERHLASG